MTLRKSVLRISLFVSLAVPATLLCLMWLQAFCLVKVYEIQGWDIETSFAAITSASTGGVVVITSESLAVTKIWDKVALASEGAFGVAVFGFVQAVLMHSVMDHVYIALRLDESATHWPRMIKLTIVFVLFLTMRATVLGGMYCLFESWPFWQSFKAFFNIELGGGISHFAKVPHPNSAFAYTVIGTLGYSTNLVMVAFLSAPLAHAYEKLFGIAPTESIFWTIIIFFKVSLIFIPLLLVLAMCIVAVLRCVLHWEPQFFPDFFWDALPAVSGGAASVSTNLHTEHLSSASDQVAFCMGCAVGFFILSGAIGVGGEVLGPIMHKGIGRARSVGYAWLVLLAGTCLGIPILVFLHAVPIGLLLSFFDDDASFGDAFWWSVAVQLGGGMTLSNLTFDKDWTRLVAVNATGVSIGISILSVALSSAPALEPLIDTFGMNVSEKEIEKLESAVFHLLEDPKE